MPSRIWVDDHLAGRKPPGPDHVGAGKERLPPRRAAPHVDARIARRALVREELPAHRRMDAVAGDCDGRPPRRQRLPCRVAEMDGHALGVLLDAGAGPAGQDALVADALPRRVEQHRLQIAAVDRELRMRVAGMAAERLGIDQLAEAVEERRLLRRHGDFRERRLEPEPSELRRRVRQEVDADPDGADLRRRLVDEGRDAGAVQRQRERQPADAGADDGDVVHRAHSAVMPASFTTLAQRARSAARRSRKRSGAPPTAASPCFSSASLTRGVARISFTAVL